MNKKSRPWIAIGIILIVAIIVGGSILLGNAKQNTNQSKTVVPVARTQPGTSQSVAVSAQQETSPTVSSPDISGSVRVFSITETKMTIQFIADSRVGNIKEMLVWTDDIKNPSWQSFSTLLELPISDHVYARFRDDLGNESKEVSDTINPPSGPSDPAL